jgi:hypothetical protein
MVEIPIFFPETIAELTQGVDKDSFLVYDTHMLNQLMGNTHRIKLNEKN